MIIIVMSYLYTTRNLVICQGFLTGAHTPGKGMRFARGLPLGKWSQEF
jgi:hypothetical protein